MASIARITEISSTSQTSFEDAIQAGINRANQTLRNVRGAWIKEQNIEINDGKVAGYRVNMLITFVLEG
ncbi:MAG: dodecin domain-containing protein [Candidatus Eremiobacteraeota bacterium]|nr:dodecin domain-containing protein [Candidatus Eremiobacteraeota bacterium]